MLWLLPFLGQTLAAPTSEVTHCGSVSTSDGLVQLVASEQCYTLATGAALEYFTSGCDCVFYESSDCSGDADYGLAENWFQRGGDFKSYACVHGGSHMTQNTGGDLGIETKSDPKTAYSQNRLYKDAIYYQDHNLQGDCRTEDKATVRDNACRDVLGLSDTPSHTSQDGSSTELVVRQDSSSVLVICTEVGFRVCGTIDKAILGTCANAPEEYRDKIKSLKMAAGTTCALYPSMGCGGRARVILGGTEITQLADLKAQGTTVNSYKCARNKVPVLPPGKRGTFIIYEHANYRGGSYIENAMGRCVTFPPYINKKASSLAQWPGSLCRYWSQSNCGSGGGRPDMAVDTTLGEILIPSLSVPIWSVDDSLSSVDCQIPPS